MLDRNEKETRISIRQRAAKVRQNWTPGERVRRTGLPPDMPIRLRAHLGDVPESVWPPFGVFQLVESRLVPLRSRVD